MVNRMPDRKKKVLIQAFASFISRSVLLVSGQNPDIHIGNRKISMEPMKVIAAQTTNIFAKKFFIISRENKQVNQLSNRSDQIRLLSGIHLFSKNDDIQRSPYPPKKGRGVPP